MNIRPVLLVLGLFSGLVAMSANGDGGNVAIAQAWYAALQNADVSRLDAMLAPDAEIVLEDIGFTQDRAEFLASMPEWRDAIADGGIAWRMDAEAADGFAAIACYRFTGNSVLAREVFSMRAGLIARSVQRKIADDCDGF
ncbi:MAG TPA: nuclear transport factor 2 family protein [Rhizobiaceae bacterium]|nr:nuclear transport factor 2 family protein [Rhizobiaceae bacterium]